MGVIEVMILDGVTAMISAGQAFQVDLYVSKQVHSNEELREQLKATTIRVISEALKKSSVALSAISESLRQAYGTDVKDVQLAGLEGSQNITSLTVLDEGERCSIRKRLVAQPDDSLIVQEDVTINFIRHERLV
jgi:uncharacterized membrane protein YcaP (DUF421 family)